MIRFLNVYFPARSLARIACEAALIGGSFLFVMALILGPDLYIGLIYENGLLKIFGITLLTLVLSYYFDLYNPQLIQRRWETYFRLLLVLSTLCFTLALCALVFPPIRIGRHGLSLGMMGISLVLLAWRLADQWMIGLPALRERVYVLGSGERAAAVVERLRGRQDAGIEVVGWTGEGEDPNLLDRSIAHLHALSEPKPTIDRVIVAMEDRRKRMPIRELLHLRVAGVRIEDATEILERLTGTLPIEGLNPSSLIYSDGFSMKVPQQILRRFISISAAVIGFILCLPILPLIALAVRMSSPGPVLFRQTRVGLGGCTFTAYKFRTMRQDAEVQGATWAKKDDPRITRVGGFLRKTRLDEIPQLWNVLRGDMAFVGPRPERPEFVEWLSREIPYYDLRHMIRPGLTGWAQVRYQYGATLEETKRKLEFDLYYLKNASIGLDLLIIFKTIKTIVLRRGAQ